MSMPKIPEFKPVTFAELANNFDQMSLRELNKYDAMGDFNNLIIASPVRAAQLTFLDSLISFLGHSKKFDESEKVAILMGALLDVKRQIKNSYIVRSPENSYVYTQVDNVLGITETNKLDAVTKQLCHRAYVAFLMHQEYLDEVMKGVEKAECLELSKTHNPDKVKNPVPQVEAKAISSAAAVLSQLKKTSPHHVTVTEKPLDPSHMIKEKSAGSKGEKLKEHQYKYAENTKHYIKTEQSMTEEERTMRIAQYDNYMRKMYWVHDDINTFNKKNLNNPWPSYRKKYRQHMLTEATAVDGNKNRRIKDVDDVTYHLEGDEIVRLNTHQYKETHLHPSVRLFDQAKLKHVEPKVEVEAQQTVKLRK